MQKRMTQMSLILALVSASMAAQAVNLSEMNQRMESSIFMEEDNCGTPKYAPHQIKPLQEQPQKWNWK